jgi:hypothetical protein
MGFFPLSDASGLFFPILVLEYGVNDKRGVPKSKQVTEQVTARRIARRGGGRF